MICRKVPILFAMFFNLGINTAIVKHRHITTELSFALSFGAHQTLPRERSHELRTSSNNNNLRN
jgi:hypothetical protein